MRAVRERSGANGALRAAEDGSERAAVLCGWVRGWKGGGEGGGWGVRGGARSGNGGGGGEGGKGAGLGRALATPTPLRPRPRGAVPALKPRPPPPRGHALFWSRPAAARSCSGHAHLAVATPPVEATPTRRGHAPVWGVRGNAGRVGGVWGRGP